MRENARVPVNRGSTARRPMRSEDKRWNGLRSEQRAPWGTQGHKKSPRRRLINDETVQPPWGPRKHENTLESDRTTHRRKQAEAGRWGEWFGPSPTLAGSRPCGCASGVCSLPGCRSQQPTPSVTLNPRHDYCCCCGGETPSSPPRRVPIERVLGHLFPEQDGSLRMVSRVAVCCVPPSGCCRIWQHSRCLEIGTTPSLGQFSHGSVGTRRNLLACSPSRERSCSLRRNYVVYLHRRLARHSRNSKIKTKAANPLSLTYVGLRKDIKGCIRREGQ